MIEVINRNLIFPAYMRWNGDDRLRLLKMHEANQWASPAELRSRQFREFQAIIEYAYEHVPFYRKRFDAIQLHPKDIKNEDHIKLIPILTKKDLQENLQLLTADVCSPSDRYQDSSGGSTGRPTTFYGDLRCSPSKDAAMLMTDKWTGWRLGEKSAYLWGADREVNRVRNLKEKIVQRYVYRKAILNAFKMNDGDMENFAHLLSRENPTLIVAYANAAYRFAKFILERGISGISPKGIVCSAETLTEERRSMIEQAFKCKVLNRYGSREVGLIGSECECQQGLHINTAGVFVELIPMQTDNPDAPNEIVVTDLQNRAMPFIRYNTGDTSVPVRRNCDCGRGLPLIGAITGRTSDFIVHPDGNMIHGEYFSHAFYGIAGVVQFQIVQPSLNLLEINIVTNNLFSKQDMERIKKKVSDNFDERMELNISIVASIPVSPSGKYRFAISHVYSLAR